ncbi:MAG: hypothetical protein PHY92_04860 [Alphaproteobacteria bacterium]|nr:hypothetical protein [Alphaproteobacteria bacterium]
MNDRGEKIISLAREMLRSEFPLPGAETQDLKKAHISLKTLCLTALLAAFGGATVAHVFDEARRPVSRYERVELNALLYYAARQKALDEESLRRDVVAKLALPGLEDISVYDFRRASDYLKSLMR